MTFPNFSFRRLVWRPASGRCCPHGSVRVQAEAERIAGHGSTETAFWRLENKGPDSRYDRLSDILRLAGGRSLGYGTDKFKRAELAPIGIRNSDDLGPQSSDGANSCRLLVERGGRNFQGQAGSSRKITPRGENGTPAAYVQDRCKIQEILPFLVNSSGKYRNG